MVFSEVPDLKVQDPLEEALDLREQGPLVIASETRDLDLQPVALADDVEEEMSPIINFKAKAF